MNFLTSPSSKQGSPTMSKLDEELAQLVREIVREEIRHALVKPQAGEAWTAPQWKIYQTVAMIPPCRVASYKGGAFRAGYLDMARIVGNALAKLGPGRVVHADGTIPKHHSATEHEVDRIPLLERVKG